MNSKTTALPAKIDVYARVTDRIIRDLEAGTRSWAKPWNTDNATGRIGRPLRFNGTPYRGVNVLMLWGEAIDNGFSSSTWMTYKQAQGLGGQVRKEQTGSLVVFAARITRTEQNGKGEEIEHHVPFLKSHTVYNVEQIDGLPAHYYFQAPSPALPPVALHQAAEDFFARTGATFRHGGDLACYAPLADVIQLPPTAAFQDPESYAATKAHELIHWTGHSSRCARQFGKRFGDQAYAFEELVAELGAAFLCAGLGITPEIRQDHSAYIAHWLQVLRKDKRAIFTAAGHAQRAVDYLEALQQISCAAAA